ncbi:MAG: hypothetical protein NVSMB22_26930 [Chloroflexota bacterium]
MDVHVIWQYLFNPSIVEGAKLTLVLAVLSQVLGIILGTLTALARMSRSPVPVVRWIAGFYVWLFRGTPLLVQIVFVYFAVPQLTNGRVILTEIVSGVIALTLNEGAYMSEIVRAGIMSVDAGQVEACESLGMTRALAMRRVILPQSVRIIIPPTGNEFISMLKNTSLLYVISVHELFYWEEQIQSATYRYFELIAVAALWYLAMTTVATYGQGYIERYFERGFTRDVRAPGMMRRAVTAGFHRG